MIGKKKKYGVSPTDVDLLSELLRSKHHSDVIDDTVISDNCFQMITAGDTSPSALNSTLYLLAKHPHIQEKLRSEILKYITDDNFTINHISSCKYLKMCIKESLRIIPPVGAPIPRRCTEPVVFSGYQIPTDSEVCYCTSTIHLNEKYWPNPEVFDPDRWDPAKSSERHTMAWFPFLSGNRNCIGASVAMLEMKIFLIMILRKYKLSFADPNYEPRISPSWVTTFGDFNVLFTPFG
eukprot:TRINITY_DN5300_c0_g1_i21.p1 TRINITY_DN5300_c0_g1~~TRINITY_DN5300_c0_g1_i21.p1  ORF type:complete len:236 (+),score=35.96 TRINITY_DN5300_c0_g1_i21:313-1020(+)